MLTKIDQLAQIIWDYHHLHHLLEPADSILVLGNTDLRTIERGIEVYKNGLSDQMIISGGLGKITSKIWDEPEADKFARLAIQNGVPANRILIENQSTNTGDNFRLVRAKLKEKKIDYHSFMVVTKPYMERRAYATFRKVWPEKRVQVTSLQVPYDNYINNGEDSKERIINLMVGDLQRIKLYPPMGFQIEQVIPDKVWAAFEELVTLGFDRFLIKR